MRDRYDELMRLFPLLEGAALAVDLGDPCSPTSDVSSIPDGNESVWYASTDAWGDIPIRENAENIELYLRLDLDTYDTDEKLAVHLEGLAKSIRSGNIK